MVHDVSFWKARSFCPSCHHIIAWYYNIPLLSWLLLRGTCRYCTAPISPLYPFIELITGLLLSTLIVTVPLVYFLAYFLFFSALIVSIRTDLETMLLSRFVTLFLVPTGFLLSAAGYLPLSLVESVLGALFGYFLLWGIARIFYLITGKEGLGQGDAELLAFIGSYLGIIGCWMTLLLGSITGSIAGIIYLLATGSKKIPFGPFLGLGAMTYLLLKQALLQLLFSGW